MLTGLLGSYRTMVSEYKWQDAPTKNTAIKKINALIFKVAYDDWILNLTNLEPIYPINQINLKHGVDWFSASLQLNKYCFL